MKDHLDKNSRENLVEYRLQRSYETLNEAECLAANLHYSGAMNRLYYACYYCVTALLIANEVMVSTHNGVRSMFGMKFIKTGIIDISIGKFFNEIFELRPLMIMTTLSSVTKKHIRCFTRKQNTL